MHSSIHSRDGGDSVATTTTEITGTQLSMARQSLKSAAALNREEFKGDKKNPPYAIDPDVEMIGTAVDRSDDDLTILDLGKKYVDVFGDIELVVADLSGNMFQDLHAPLKPFAGVKEAFNLLKQHNIPMIMVTNSWRTSKKSIVELLQSGGYDVNMEDIFTSSDACKLYLKEKNLGRPYYLVHDDVLQDFASEFPRRADEDVVIIGLPSTQFDYRLFSKGMDLLINGKPMISLNMMKKDSTPNVLNASLGPGPFITMLELCTDSEPITLCKPFPQFYEALCDKIGVSDYSKIVVIGDDIHEDIIGAKALGMKAILTRTGSYQVNDEKLCSSGSGPDATAENFVMAIRCILAAQAVSHMSESDFLEENSSRGCAGSASTIVRDDALTKKIEAYINTEPKSKREVVENLIKMPSYIW